MLQLLFVLAGFQSCLSEQIGSKWVEFHKDAKSWESARQVCQKTSGEMVNFDGKLEKNAWFSGHKGLFWLDGQQTSSTGVFAWKFGDDSCDGGGKWVGGEPGSFRYCLAGRTPNDQMAKECGTKLPFFCQQPLKTYLKNKGFDTSSVKGRAFKIFKTKDNVKNARSTCKKNAGSHLVTVNNVEMKNFVQKQSKANAKISFWIGLSTTSKDSEINGKPSTRVWKWDSGVKFNDDKGKTSFWAEGEPNNALAAKNEQCVEFYHSGNWNDAPCDWGLAFICELMNVN